ncbi:DHA2 family efflux MFS transporter permease subunit [Alicyclobacillus suci]|uniref:DHA2 family efflux MFS transporter permease subunit n=1 Tax=Alicyclobacillus suci TaxID=2816080 RepID=UPI001A902507|nr:DHA2 family efflux MFS transporter permease subunit [Alicyclobacillus suci]
MGKEDAFEEIKFPYLQLAILIIGTFMAVLDNSIVNVAIPKMETALNSNTNQIQWVITAYMLVSGITIPMTSWLSDKFGSKQLFTYSLIFFTIGSTLCGMAWNLPSMILFRIIQALGGGFLMPLANTLLYKIFPPEKRGGVMGIFGLAVMLAPAFGPLLSGYFVQYASWRLIFYMNLPLGVVGAFLSIFVLHDFNDKSASKLDAWGLALSSIGLFSLLYGFTNVSSNGWRSTSVYPYLIAGSLLLIILVAVELKVDKPLIEFRVLKDYLLSMSVVITSLVQLTMFVSLFLLPLYFENILEYTPEKTGIFMTPAALISAVFMVAGGLLLNRVGARLLAVVGLTMTLITTYGFAFLDVNTPSSHLQILYIFRTIGVSLALMPVMAAGMNRLPNDLISQASGLSNTIRQVASSLGTAIFTYYEAHRTLIHESEMASQYNPGSPKGLELNGLESNLMQHGMSAAQAHVSALETVLGIIDQNSFVAAINDTFMVGTILTAISLVLTFFFNDKQYSKAREGTHITMME